MSSSHLSPIRLRAFDSPLGPMLGGASTTGICLCEFADRGGEARIVTRLEKRHRCPVFTSAEWTSEGESAGLQADGGLRGYGGGLDRKRWLLDLEAGSHQLSL